MHVDRLCLPIATDPAARPAQVTWAEQLVPITRRQTRALLYRLAADMHPVLRTQLCYLFWPDVAARNPHRL